MPQLLLELFLGLLVLFQLYREFMNKSRFFKVSLIYFISLVLFVLLRIFFQLNVFQKIDSNWQDILSSGLIQIVLMFLLPMGLYFLFFKTKPKETFSELGFKKISFKAVLICFAIGIIAFILNIAVSSIFNGIIRSLGYNPSSSAGSSTSSSFLNFLLQVVLVSVLPAFCEEFMHRGVLLRGLSKSVGVKSALIISSVLFGLMHLNIVQVFYATILGLLIGFVSVVGKSIIPAIIIHFVNNFLNVYLSFAEANSWPLGDFYSVINSFFQNNNLIIVLIVVVLVLIFLIFLLFALILNLLKISSFSSFKNVLANIKENLNGEVVKYENSNEIQNEVDYINEVAPIIMENIPQHSSALNAILGETNAPKEALKFSDKIFFIASLILGIVITVFTFIWGVI